MDLNPDYTQAAWEAGSALLQLLNVRAVRRAKKIEGIHWLPTAYYFFWGVYNIWFYVALALPWAFYASLGITAVNLTWLAHVWYYKNYRGTSK